MAKSNAAAMATWHLLTGRHRYLIAYSAQLHAGGASSQLLALRRYASKEGKGGGDDDEKEKTSLMQKLWG